MTKKTFKIEGMDCDACAKMIELDLEDAGISASCNYANATLEVELKDDHSEEKKVMEVVSRSGYQLVTT